jgi:uncharacterized phage protein (TIGR01671 family)
MNEIKFRGKRKDNGEWVCGWLAGDTQTFIISSFLIVHKNTGEKTIDSSCSSIYEVIPETVGQYTGTKDKNDKKAYPGDVAKFYECSDEYLFFHGIAKIMDTTIGWTWEIIKQGNEFLDSSSFWNDDFEIIGNIYDNPELLEK